jgi:hypothetical protein
MKSDGFCIGGDVAILPAFDAEARETLEIVRAESVNAFVVRLADGRVYSRIDRAGLTQHSEGYIAPATDEHRAAIEL